MINQKDFTSAHIDTCPKCGKRVNGVVDPRLGVDKNEQPYAVFSCQCGNRWHASSSTTYSASSADKIRKDIVYHKSKITQNLALAIIYFVIFICCAMYCWFNDFNYRAIGLDDLNRGMYDYDHYWFPLLIVALATLSVSIARFSMFVSHRTAVKVLTNMQNINEEKLLGGGGRKPDPRNDASH
jgi:hypothetical protein